MFETSSHNFGPVAKGSKAEYEFVLTNKYAVDVHIAGVQASCSCTTPRIEKELLKPYEKGTIVAHLNSDNYLGQRARHHHGHLRPAHARPGATAGRGVRPRERPVRSRQHRAGQRRPGRGGRGQTDRLSRRPHRLERPPSEEQQPLSFPAASSSEPGKTTRSGTNFRCGWPRTPPAATSRTTSS